MNDAIQLRYTDESNNWKSLLNPSSNKQVYISPESIKALNNLTVALLGPTHPLISSYGQIDPETLTLLVGKENTVKALKAIVYAANSGSKIVDNFFKNEQNEPANFFIILSNFSDIGGAIAEIAEVIKKLYDVTTTELYKIIRNLKETSHS